MITKKHRQQFEDLNTLPDENKAAVLAAVLETLEGCLKEDGKKYNARIVRESRELLLRLVGPLTLGECRDVLNANRHLFDLRGGACREWVETKSVPGVLFNGFDSLTPFEATALARAFLVQGGAA